MAKTAFRTGTRLQQLISLVTSGRPHWKGKPLPRSRLIVPGVSYLGEKERKFDREKIMEGDGDGDDRRVPLSLVVSDCVKRWFNDTLKEAKSGDVTMQVMVGQMYNSGYGIPRDVEKAKVWISQASKSRPSAWKVIKKRPGYNVTDSDSDACSGS